MNVCTVPIPYKKDARLIWVKYIFRILRDIFQMTKNKNVFYSKQTSHHSFELLLQLTYTKSFLDINPNYRTSAALVTTRCSTTFAVDYLITYSSEYLQENLILITDRQLLYTLYDVT